jgi:hypothetical protein
MVFTPANPHGTGTTTFSNLHFRFHPGAETHPIPTPQPTDPIASGTITDNATKNAPAMPAAEKPAETSRIGTVSDLIAGVGRHTLAENCEVVVCISRPK